MAAHGHSGPVPDAERLRGNEWRSVRVLLPYLMEYPRPRAARAGAAGVGQARQRRRAADDEGHRRRSRPQARGGGGAGGAARGLRPAALLDHAVRRAARRGVRARDAARHPPRGAERVPPPARAVAALPPRPPDRRHDARHRARHARHLDAAVLPAVFDHSGHPRIRPRGGGAARQVRLALRRGHLRRGRGLHRASPSRSPNGASTSGAAPTSSIRRPTRAPSTACSTTRR